ncbi:MAG: response regulator [Prevotellaceae bacterium]|jgi:signal transduction histidine kinase/ligand-binding sensor domain-containing protein/DNA-binding response OmpR family regulator|nr:response regulator [Prevotellaceae bacterium]
MTSIYKTILTAAFLLVIACTATEHAVQEKSREGKTIAKDISNQMITSFAEDDLGHIWIGTIRGANKNSIHEIHQYFSSADSLSLSDNTVTQIYRDSQNRLWFATVNGICIYTDSDCFKRIPIEAQSQNVLQIIEDSHGRMFINLGYIMCRYSEEKARFEPVNSGFNTERTFNGNCFADRNGNIWVISANSINKFSSPDIVLKETFTTDFMIYYAFMRNNGELWLGSGSSLFIFDTRTGKYVKTPETLQNHPLLSKTIITHMHQYSKTALLINTQAGLFIYNFVKDDIVFQTEESFPFQAPNFRITTMFTDSQDNLWIGSIDQGYVIKYSYKELFNNNYYLVSTMKRKSVTSAVVDKNDNLWMSTSLNGLFVYNPSSKTIKNFDTKQFISSEQIFKAGVSSLFVDADNYIWLLTEINEIIKCRYDGNDSLHKEAVFQLPAVIFCMVQDDSGTIFAAGYGGNIYMLRKGETEFTQKQLYTAAFVFTSSMFILSTGELLVSSFNQNLQLINTDTWDVSEIEIRNLIRRSLFIPESLFEDSEGNIWTGTKVNGLFRYSRQTGKMEEMPGTSCSDISSINEDGNKNIWAGTLYGLSKYDMAADKFTNYYTGDGIGGNQFNSRSSCLMADGTLVFGGTHGLTLLNSKNKANRRNIPLLFEDLKIHNRLIIPAEGECINKHLAYKPSINLKYSQNSFSISFTALNYSEYEQVRYFYMMEGFDRIWIDANSNREAYYSNLPSGKYRFKVKITSNDETVADTENSIPVIVFPAPWQSAWAYCGYFLLVLTITATLTRIYLKIKKEKEFALRAQNEKEQEQRVNKMNMSFFANISHEFRTPLTMISGPVTQMCNDTSIDDKNKKLLYIIERSVNRMLKLVNQLLDFNKIENGMLKLRVNLTDIISVLARQIDIFRINANNKNISLDTCGLDDSFIVWLDADKFDKIIGNLMSNALKFTKTGGNISITFDVIRREIASQIFNLTDKDVDNEYVKISVANTGAEIPEDKLEKIFERYFQLENKNQGIYNWGTGIGLYYTRCLIEVHHGYIKADNRDDGSIVFTFILPVNDIVYGNEERRQSSDEQDIAFPLLTGEQYYLNEKEISSRQYALLVVEDDTEIAHYLKVLLSPYYKIITRFDAPAAFEAVKNESPDLVVSDVVMPGSSGYELCKLIKEDIQSCHIPVILLTAKITIENQVEGLNSGADAYVTKPFDPNYLLALINSQLKNRENIRRILSKSTQTDKIAKNMLSPQDNAFMTELYGLMENELSNTELNISRMINVLKISRTKFYYKVKGLTGENPNVFFKTYKLNRAAQLLSEGKYKISEVADMTGFSTLSHFSVSFKKQFGVSPSEYYP